MPRSWKRSRYQSVPFLHVPSLPSYLKNIMPAGNHYPLKWANNGYD